MAPDTAPKNTQDSIVPASPRNRRPVRRFVVPAILLCTALVAGPQLYCRVERSMRDSRSLAPLGFPGVLPLDPGATRLPSIAHLCVLDDDLGRLTEHLRSWIAWA